MLLFTYECNEQSTAELQKLSAFHTTVTYATAKLHILFEMDNQNTENIVNGHIFSSSEVIDKVLNAIGLTRDALSTYQQYQYPNGDYMRLRVSNHGIFLQHWFDKNREARMDGQNVPKLDVGLNLAITFAPNEQECLAMGKPFPMKIKNVTAAKTQQGNNVKPQFKVRHICYYSWMLTQEDVNAISASLSNCITNGEDYKEPLQGNPDKVVEWEDTSNLPPKKVEGNSLQQSRDNNELNTEQYMNKKQIRLTEADLKQIVKESVKIILNEAYYDHNFADLLAQHGGYDKKKKNNTMYGSGSITTDISYDDVDIVAPNEDFAMGYIWAKYYKDKSDYGVDVNTSSGLYNLHDFLYDMSVHLSDGSILIFKQDAYDKLNNPQEAEKKRKQREFDRYHYNDGYQPVMNAKNHTSYNNDDFYFTKNGDYADKMRDTIYK